MTIVTRYRDISWEEVNQAHTVPPFKERGTPEQWESKRGQIISVYVPATRKAPCGQPFYEVINYGPPPHWACGHIAEIGD